jgi:hypothetical protein
MKKSKRILGIFTISGLATMATVGTVFAQTATTTDPGTATSTQVTCIQNALDKRENALITAHDTYSAAVKAALTNRLTALKVAVAQTDKKIKVDKRQLAYKAFRTEVQTANTALRNSKNTTWKNYQSDAKACGVKATGESPSLVSGANISL